MLGTGHSAEFAMPEGRRRATGKLAEAAVEALANEESGVMVALRGTRVDRVPLEDVVGKERPLDPDLYKIAEVLAGLPE